MSAPRGNKYAVGNRGGGRKSAAVDRADADLLWRLFTEPMKLDEVKERLRSGHYSLLDAVVSKAYAGNERILCMLLSKCFPDREQAMVIAPKLVEVTRWRAADGTMHEADTEIPGPNEVARS